VAAEPLADRADTNALTHEIQNGPVEQTLSGPFGFWELTGSHRPPKSIQIGRLPDWSKDSLKL
jgi:hypothetical protein